MRTRLLWYLSPALALSVFSETVAQYLLAQSKALPIMASSLVGLTLSPLLYWGAVFWRVPMAPWQAAVTLLHSRTVVAAMA
jgi:hypothetical protein